MKKNYVLDTNILMHCPSSILGLDDNNVFVTDVTIQELDKHKKDLGETGFNVRHVVKFIKELQGDYEKGIELSNGGTFYIISGQPIDNKQLNIENKEEGETNWDNSISDNLILGAVIKLKEEDKEKETILITNDSLLNIKARILGVPVQEYKNEQILTEHSYTGRDTLYIDANHIDQLYRDKELNFEEEFYEYLESEEKILYDNEFILVKDSPIRETSTKSALCVYREYGNVKKLVLIDNEDVKLKNYNIVPKNSGQTFALSALLAPASELPLVILKGQAGTAKTFLSLAAGLVGLYSDKNENQYNKILITRNNVLFDSDMGYLPGTEEEKMAPLVRGLYDNLEEILRLSGSGDPEISMQIEDMVDTGLLKVESMAYMRGRSISNTYIIIDEAQNATINQILGIITRVGIGSKIILCGDENQIDNLKLDKKNNGLVYASEKMKGSSLCAQITFNDKECVRSALALEAANRLTSNTTIL